MPSDSEPTTLTGVSEDSTCFRHAFALDGSEVLLKFFGRRDKKQLILAWGCRTEAGLPADGGSTGAMEGSLGERTSPDLGPTREGDAVLTLAAVERAVSDAIGKLELRLTHALVATNRRMDDLGGAVAQLQRSVLLLQEAGREPAS